MHTFQGAVAFGVVVLALSGVQSLAQGTDQIVGTWELNVAKSKFSPGPAPKSETRTYVMAGADIKATAKGVDGAGKQSRRHGRSTTMARTVRKPAIQTLRLSR